jgi:hypothetical protein
VKAGPTCLAAAAAAAAAAAPAAAAAAAVATVAVLQLAAAAACCRLLLLLLPASSCCHLVMLPAAVVDAHAVFPHPHNHSTTHHGEPLILQDGMTPLHGAANKGHKEVVRQLLAGGAAIDAAMVRTFAC